MAEEIRREWAITTPGMPDEANGEMAYADGTRWVQVWDRGYFDGPTLYSREEMEAFIAELREVADRVWPTEA